MTNGIGRVGWRNYVATTPSTSSIVTNGLVLNLDASNPLSYSGTGTTWTDLSGNGNNTTLYNGASYSSVNGGAISFDGINDYALGNMNGFNNSASFTTITWFNANQVSSEQHLTNLKGTPPTQLYVSGGRIGTYDYGNAAGGTVLANTWYMVVCTRDSTGIGKIYLNGQLVSTSTLKSYTGVSQYIIGNFGGGGNYYFGGKIGISQIYNRDLSLSEIQQNFNATKERFGYPSYTTRTTAFATATGITDTTILNALNTFDTGLISNGLDTKMKALYPFVGGTASTHKYNFMDARDLDVAFRLQFNGGWTHNSTGAKPNGSNAYANTYLSPYAQLTLGSRHLSMYASDNSQANIYSIDMGAYDSAGGKSNHLSIHRDADNVVGQLNNWGNQSLTSTNNSTGLLLINRPSISSSKAFKNGILLASTTNDITGQVMPNLSIYLGNSNDNGGINGSVGSSRGFSLSTIGSGLSDTEASTFYTLVQTLQTALGRQV